ncbi:MAG: DUF6600 domain-containing protein [Verrucomicrobiota bacterium]
MKKNNWPYKTVCLGIGALASLLSGCTTYMQAPAAPVTQPVYVAPPPAQYVAPEPSPAYSPAPAPEVVVIRSENDFYEPLRPYGRWLDVPGYGRCFTPTGIDADWRPYTDGHWQRTDAGWYWVSDERWGWATCHYGRWHRDGQFGWVWIPQTQWAPAWVAWRDGGGYTGWAPLPPEAKFGSGGILEQRDEDLDEHTFVFVKQEQMLEPHRHQDVIVNNLTIINKTVSITKIQVVNNIVINGGPRPEEVARATGRKIEAMPVRTLRAQQEAHVITQPKGPATMNYKAPAADSRQSHAPAGYNPGRLPVANPELKPSHPTTVPEQSANQPGQPPRTVTPEFKPEPHSRTNLPAEHKREVGRPEPQPEQPKVSRPDQIKSQSHPVTGQPVEHANEVKQPGQPALTPQQKLEQEKRRQADEKRQLQEEKSHRPASTNSPAPPH